MTSSTSEGSSATLVTLSEGAEPGFTELNVSAPSADLYRPPNVLVPAPTHTVPEAQSTATSFTGEEVVSPVVAPEKSDAVDAESIRVRSPAPAPSVPVATKRVSATDAADPESGQ